MALMLNIGVTFKLMFKSVKHELLFNRRKSFVYSVASSENLFECFDLFCSHFHHQSRSSTGLRPCDTPVPVLCPRYSSAHRQKALSSSICKRHRHIHTVPYVPYEPTLGESESTQPNRKPSSFAITSTSGNSTNHQSTWIFKIDQLHFLPKSPELDSTATQASLQTCPN